MSSFTGVGDSLELQLTEKGEDVAISISGTYNMTILFQVEVGSPGSGAWQTINTYTTANDTVAATYTTTKKGEKVRLIVTVDTSGTAVATLTDTSVLDFPEADIRDPSGGLLASFNQDGLILPTSRPRINGIPVNDANRAVLFEDFIGTWAIGDAGPADLWSSTAGSGTSNAVATTVANSLNGEVTISSASDDGVHSANGSTFTGINLGYKANQGGLEMGVRISIDDVSEAAIFIGFTDTISTTVELPIFMNGAAVDSDATNACGIIYDIDATTDKFYVAGVKAGTDTAPVALTSVIPVDATYFDAVIRVDTDGVVEAWVNDLYLGSVAAAITVTTAVTPAIIVANRSANQVIATVDYIWTAQNR